MQVDFRNKHLIDLYQKGTSKKYKIQPDILKKFIMRIQEIEAARDIYDLWNRPALNFEKMRGHESRYSLRVQDKWRLEMEIEWQNEEMTIGNVFIVELSSHYK